MSQIHIFVYAFVGIALLDGLKTDLITKLDGGRDNLRKQIQDALTQALEQGGRGQWHRLREVLQLLETCVEWEAFSNGFDRRRLFLFTFVQ